MFKLFKLNEDKYVILDSDGMEFEGDGAKVIARMLRMGVEQMEIFYGMEALVVHDVADYGINKTFIFSKNLSKRA